MKEIVPELAVQDLAGAEAMLCKVFGFAADAALLRLNDQRIALVQAGYRNRFGHPAPEVLQRYAQRNVPVVESARCGAASWSSAQPQAVACERDSGRRYWQHVVP